MWCDGIKRGKYGTFLCSSVVLRLSPGPLPQMGLSTGCKREAFVQREKRAFRRMLSTHIESGVECRSGGGEIGLVK